MLRLACGIMSRTVQDGRRDIQLSRRRPYRETCHLREITGGHVPGRPSQSLAVAARTGQTGEHSLPQARSFELRDHGEELRL
jgi:hypothetical protein